MNTVTSMQDKTDDVVEQSSVPEDADAAADREFDEMADAISGRSTEPSDGQSDAEDDQAGDEEADQDSPSEADDDGPPDEDDTDGKDETETVDAQIKRLLQKQASETGRIAAAGRRAKELEDQITALRGRLPPQSDATGADDEDEELEKQLAKAREEYGDLGIGLLDDKIAKLQARDRDLTARDKADLQRLEMARDELIGEQEAIFTSEHKDGFDVISGNRQRFDLWLAAQDDDLIRIFRENGKAIVDGTSAALLVSRFKQFLGSKSEAPARTQNDNRQSRIREEQRSGGKSVRGSRTPLLSGSPSDYSDDPDKAFDAMAEKVKRKMGIA